MATTLRNRLGPILAPLLFAAALGAGLIAASPQFAQAAAGTASAGQSLTVSANQTVPAFGTNTARPASDALNGVSCLSATFCIAVGESASSQPIPTPKALAERWDGHQWVVLHSASGPCA